MANPRGKRKSRGWIGAVAFLLLAAAGAAGFYRMQKTQKAGTLATATSKRGEFTVVVRSRGELTARRSAWVIAPQGVPDMRIIWQVPPNTEVKEGDPVLRLDPSSIRVQLAEKQATLQQSQATLDQAMANARITSEQDKRDNSTARYAVERAGMEVDKQAIVSKLKGEESAIDFDLSKKRLAVQEATMGVHDAGEKVRMSSLLRQLELVKADIALNESRLTQLELKAPIAGVIVYQYNYQMMNNNPRPFAVGDTIWSGAILAQVPDLSTIEMDSKIEEVDRGRIKANMDARIRIDALPELNLEAKLGRISPLSQISFREWPATSSFRGYAQVLKPDKRLRPGMAGAVDVVIQRIPDAISIPSKALFTRQGRPVVYVAKDGRYDPYEVKVIARNPDEVAVEGIPAGAAVTLVDPAAQKGAKK